MKTIDQSTKGLRRILFDEIDSIREGTTSHVRANSVARLATSIIESAKLEIEIAKAGKESPLQIESFVL